MPTPDWMSVAVENSSSIRLFISELDAKNNLLQLLPKTIPCQVMPPGSFSTDWLPAPVALRFQVSLPCAVLQFVDYSSRIQSGMEMRGSAMELNSTSHVSACVLVRCTAQFLGAAARLANCASSATRRPPNGSRFGTSQRDTQWQLHNE